ncbi:MAG: alpha/beta fold hydrolase [Lachnospiraceae bacterium]
MKLTDKVKFVIGDSSVIAAMSLRKERSPYGEEAMDFLGAWSENIRLLPRNKKDGAVSAFGFWCRRTALEEMKREFEEELQMQGGVSECSSDYAGRGICLQFVPSNIPALFAYNIAAGLIAGNAVIQRLPSGFEGGVLLETLRETLKGHAGIAEETVLLQYDHDDSITAKLTGLCDARIIWGGDATVEKLRSFPLKNTAADIAFPTRHSMAVLGAGAVLDSADLAPLIRDFFNDTYLNDQNACSAPGIIYWKGSREEVEKARKIFWSELEEFLRERYILQPLLSVKKLEKALLLAANDMGEKIMRGSAPDENKIFRIWTDILTPEHWKYLCPGGFFIESSGENFEGLRPVLTSDCQTVTYYGVDRDEVKEKILDMAGADAVQLRVVPAGSALDFDMKWDGHDLLKEQICRRTEILYIENDGHRLYCKRRGRGPALLLIHGVATDSDFFDGLSLLLENHFTVISYDRRGHSRSVPVGETKGDVSLPQDYSVEAQAGDAAAVLEALADMKAGLPTVVGFSGGGLVALVLSKDRPDLVGRMMMYETVYGYDEVFLDKVDKWKDDLRKMADKGNIAKAMLMFVKMIGEKDPSAPGTSTKQMRRNMTNLSHFLQHEMESFLGFARNNPDIELSMPCVCGAGSFNRDRLFYKTMKDCAARYGWDFAEVEGYHNVALERPANFARWIAERVDISSDL